MLALPNRLGADAGATAVVDSPPPPAEELGALPDGDPPLPKAARALPLPTAMLAIPNPALTLLSVNLVVKYAAPAGPIKAAAAASAALAAAVDDIILDMNTRRMHKTNKVCLMYYTLPTANPNLDGLDMGSRLPGNRSH